MNQQQISQYPIAQRREVQREEGHQPRRYILRGFAMALLSTSALAGYAFAQKGESLQATSGWSSSSVSGKGDASYCAVARRFDGNVIMTLARNMRDETSLALDFDSAQFERQNVFQISLDPGAGAQRSMTLKPSSEKAFVFKLGKDETFYRGLAKTGFLRAEIGEKGYNFNLSDVDTATEKLTRCLSQMGTPVAEAVEPVPEQVAVETYASIPTPMPGEMVIEPGPSPVSAPLASAEPETESKLQELSQRLAMLENRKQADGQDPLKAPLPPELPLERVTLRPLHDMVEVTEASVSKITPAPATVKIRPHGRSAPADELAPARESVTKVDQSLIVEMAEENRKLKDKLAEAEKAPAAPALDTVERDDLKSRLQKLESENKSLSRKLEASESQVVEAVENESLSSRDAATIEALRAQNDRLVASLARVQTAAGQETLTTPATPAARPAYEYKSTDSASRDLQRQVSVLESQNRVLTERLDSLLGQNGDYSRQVARYEVQVQEMERKLSEALMKPEGPNYEAMVQALKEEIAAVQSENIMLREEKAKPDPKLVAEIDQLRAENDTLNADITRAESEIFVLQEKISTPDPALEGKVSALETENKLLSEQVAAAQSEVFLLKQQASVADPALEGELAALKTENDLLNRQLGQMQSENTDLQAAGAQGADQSAEVEKLKAEIALVEEENLRLKQAAPDVNTKLEGELAALRTENELLNLEIARQSDLAKAEYDAKLVSFKAENEKLQERLALYVEKPDSLAALKAEMETLKTHKEELSITVADLQAQAKKLEILEQQNKEKADKIAALQSSAEELEAENAALKQASVDVKASEAKDALSLADVEEKLEKITLENEGLRTEVKSLQTTGADIKALKKANAELTALLDEAQALDAEQKAALSDRQAEIETMAKAMEEGASQEVAALEAEIKKLGADNKALKDELGEAQIALISLKQDSGKEVSAALEEDLAQVEPAAGPAEETLDLTEETAPAGEKPTAVDDIAKALNIDEPVKTAKAKPAEQLEFGFEPRAAQEEDEAVAVEKVPAAAPVAEKVAASNAPVPLSKPHRVAAAKPAPEPKVAAPVEEVAEEVSAVEPAAGDDVPAEQLLSGGGPTSEQLAQQAEEEGMTEAQRQEMALAREVGSSSGVSLQDPELAHQNRVDAEIEAQAETQVMQSVPAPVQTIEAEDLGAPEQGEGDRSGDTSSAVAPIADVPAVQASAPAASSEYQPAVPIENILSAAHIPVDGTVKLLDDISGPNLVAYQWTSEGGLFGSAQQKPARDEAQFEAMVQEYLTKTEDRCTGDFAVSPSSTQGTGGTRIDSYEIACIGGGVDSSASLLFFQQDGTFTAVAHESPTHGMASAMDYRDRLIASLRKS